MKQRHYVAIMRRFEVISQQVMQRTYKVTMGRICVTIVAMAAQQLIPFVLLSYVCRRQ